jgi:hypothetical protein
MSCGMMLTEAKLLGFKESSHCRCYSSMLILVVQKSSGVYEANGMAIF